MKRLARRIGRVEAAVGSGGLDGVQRALVASEIEDWAEDATPQMLEALLEEIDALRPEPDASRPVPAGEFFVYRWGRSLATGEAEVASRGFFDVWDRPPPEFWVEVFVRPQPRNAAGDEVAVLAYVCEREVARAEAGRVACSSGALAGLAEVSPSLAEQLGPLLGGRSTSG